MPLEENEALEQSALLAAQLLRRSSNKEKRWKKLKVFRSGALSAISPTRYQPHYLHNLCVMELIIFVYKALFYSNSFTTSLDSPALSFRQ